MKKRSFLRVFVLLLCAMLLLTACSSGSSSGESSNKKSNDSTPNTYETPLKALIERMNTKKITDIDILYITPLNGFAEDEVKTLFKAARKSANIQDGLDQLIKSEQESIDARIDAFGDNHKHSYKIDKEEKLEEQYLRDLEDLIEGYGEELKSLIEETGEYSEDDWQNAADAMGMSKSQVKAYVKALEDLQKEIESIEVTTGYEIAYTVTLTGSKLDEPDEFQRSVRVYEVNGRWIAEEAFSHTFMIIRMMLMHGSAG